MNPFQGVVQALSRRDRDKACALLERLGAADLEPAQVLLALHLNAVIGFGAGDAEAGEALLQRASQVERETGDVKSAHHSVHQINLMIHLKGDMQRLASYYTDTMRTLKTARNLEGTALCLKTLGLMAVVAGDPTNGPKLLARSAELMGKVGLPDQAVIARWVELLRAT